MLDCEGLRKDVVRGVGKCVAVWEVKGRVEGGVGKRVGVYRV